MNPTRLKAYYAASAGATGYCEGKTTHDDIAVAHDDITDQSKRLMHYLSTHSGRKSLLNDADVQQCIDALMICLCTSKTKMSVRVACEELRAALDVAAERLAKRGNPDRSQTDFQSYTPEALRDILQRHGLTNKRAGQILGVDSRTIRKWTSDPSVISHRAMPTSAWRLLLLLVGEVAARDMLDTCLGAR